jgi:hypothetical protein
MKINDIAWWGLGGAAVATYFAFRFLSATPIESPADTQKGIQERAAAIEKVLRYDDWMDTRARRGGWLKGILLWPIKPSEQELKGASEFASLAYEAQAVSVEQFNCTAVAGGGEVPSEAEVKYLGQMAELLLSPEIKWQDPPVMTALEAAKSLGNCEKT